MVFSLCLVFSVFSVVAASVAVPGSAFIYALQRLSTGAPHGV
jgi:hypothetical protein